MKKLIVSILMICFSTMYFSESPKVSDNQTGKDVITNENYNLEEKVLYSRVFESVIWGMPAVNYEMMHQAFVKNLKGNDNQILFWSKPSDWKNQFLTPNAEVLYFMPFFNTKDVGPVVIEIPKAESDNSIVGSIMDSWQAALEDVGPAGADKGNGGKYLILPPDYKGEIPTGYIVLPSENYTGYALLRSMPKSTNSKDVASALEYGKKIKIYPLSSIKNPPKTKFLDAVNTVMDGSIPYDERYFELLNNVVQAEPWLARDKAMIETLKTVGIKKGDKFQITSDPKKLEIIKSAAKDAQKWIDREFESMPTYFSTGKWFLPVDEEVVAGFISNYSVKDSYPLDQRAMLFFWAFSSIKHAGDSGQNQKYIIAARDKNGDQFDGSKTYHLSVPANVPAKQYWSVTLYNRDTHTLIRNVSHNSLASFNSKIKINEDKTVDIYFGPKAPNGKESNWIPTKAGEKFEVLFRFYGAEKPIFDKTWVLPDVEKID